MKQVILLTLQTLGLQLLKKQGLKGDHLAKHCSKLVKPHGRLQGTGHQATERKFWGDGKPRELKDCLSLSSSDFPLVVTEKDSASLRYIGGRAEWLQGRENGQGVWSHRGEAGDLGSHGVGTEQTRKTEILNANKPYSAENLIVQSD